MTTDQWTLLSNLSHCFDEQDRLSYAKSFLVEQNRQPIKIRYKIPVVCDFLQTIVGGVQFLYEKNNDFLTVNRIDQSILLQNTLKQVGGIIASFTLRASQLYEDSQFYRAIETIYGPETINSGVLASSLLDPDFIFVKLVLAMMIFSTMDCTFYLTRNNFQFNDVRLILINQDRYAELAWRYLIYKYDHPRAVRAFSNLIRCLLLSIRSLTAAAEAQQFHTLMNSVVEQTEQVLRIQK